MTPPCSYCGLGGHSKDVCTESVEDISLPRGGSDQEVELVQNWSDAEENGEDDEWDPQPAKLREGETRHVSGHARANLQQLKIAERQGITDAENEREPLRPGPEHPTPSVGCVGSRQWSTTRRVGRSVPAATGVIPDEVLPHLWRPDPHLRWL